MIIKIKVITNAKKQKIELQPDKSLKIHLISQPARGKANQELIELLADYYHLSKSQIKIIQGETAKNKIIEIKQTETMCSVW